MIADEAGDILMDRVALFQHRLYWSAKADPQRSYGVLYDKLCRLDVLREAWRQVKRSGGCAGVDRQTITQIEREGEAGFLMELQNQLERGEYQPELIRRTYIPKPDGRQRPLGIPTVKDRVVQAAVKMIIEPLFEADFLDCSHGFRPCHSAHGAIAQIDAYLRKGYRWVVDVDLKSYFDTIPHELLMRLVQRRVRDPRLLRLLRQWLKAGILDQGAIIRPQEGTPQGGVLSPLLANVYLHEVDQKWQTRKPRAQLVRYADDLLILCPTEEDAKRELAELREVLTQMGLTLNLEKTRIVERREGFDFLGFRYRCGKYERGGKQREIMVKVPRPRAEQSLRDGIKEMVQRTPLGETVAEVVKGVNRKLRGWANYFRIANMVEAVRGLIWFSTRQLRLFLRRRYQRKRSQHGRRWPDGFFHEQLGLYRVEQLCPKD